MISAAHINDPSHVQIKIADDGKGFDYSLSDTGMGLAGMRERALSEVTSNAHGTTILCIALTNAVEKESSEI